MSQRSIVTTAVSALLGALSLARPLAPMNVGLEAALSEPIVAAASKSARTRAPRQRRHTITSDDLRRYGIHSLDEALNYLSLGFVTQNPLHASTSARAACFSRPTRQPRALARQRARDERAMGRHGVLRTRAGIRWSYRSHRVSSDRDRSSTARTRCSASQHRHQARRGVPGLHLVAEVDLYTAWRAAVGFGSEFNLFGKPAELTMQPNISAFAPSWSSTRKTTGTTQ